MKDSPGMKDSILKALEDVFNANAACGPTRLDLVVTNAMIDDILGVLHMYVCNGGVENGRSTFCCCELIACFWRKESMYMHRAQRNGNSC